MKAPTEEGWYTDPFGRHEARWLSAGKPTRLVRDGELEGFDDPTDEEPTSTAVKLEAPESSGPDDLKRADQAEAIGDSAIDMKRADDAEAAAAFGDEILVDAATDLTAQTFPKP